MRKIEDIYEQFRTANGDNILRSRLSVQNIQFRALLVAKTQFLKIFFVT